MVGINGGGARCLPPGWFCLFASYARYSILEEFVESILPPDNTLIDAYTHEIVHTNTPVQ